MSPRRTLRTRMRTAQAGSKKTRKEKRKMKTKRITFLKAAVIFVLTFCVLSISVFALDSDGNGSNGTSSIASDEPTLEIASYNLSYSNSVYILYAVSNEGFDRRDHEIKMLFWNELQEEYTVDNASYVATNRGKTTVNGTNCLVFYSEGLAAKEMTTDIYSRACVEIDGEYYYSEVMKFSVLEYVYAMREKGNVPANLNKLFNELLDYGASAQNNFNHKTDRPANASYHGVTVKNGSLPDGFRHGRYRNKEVVALTADAPAEGMRFSHWVDENGIIVSYDKVFEIVIGNIGKTYEAIYKDISNIVTQLKLKAEIPFNGDLDDVDLPTAVSIEIGGETVTLEVSWNTDSFTPGVIGTKTYYASLLDTEAYVKYGIEPGSIIIEVSTLPFSYEIDTATGEYILTGYHGNAESVTIPSTYKNTFVSTIRSKAFNVCEGLREVIIPSTVTKIESAAFFYCDDIERITIPFVGESLNSSNSWFGWIFGAESYDIQNSMLPLAIKSVTLTEGATTIPSYAFYKCTQIEEFNLPKEITSLGGYAFGFCTQLTEFTFPKSLTSLSEDAFIYSSNLKRINVESVDMLFGLSTFNRGPFSYGAELYCNGKPVTEVIIPNGVTTVSGILQGCSSIKKITVPSSVTTLGWKAFNGMTSLAEVVFEDPSKISTINNYAFCGCSSLQSIDLSAFTNVTVLYGTFEGCTNLTEIKLPENLTSITEYTFSRTAIKEIILPDSIQQIPSSCFSGCKNLETIDIPDGAVEIANYAFIGCSNLRAVKMPKALTNIGSSAFSNCYSLSVIDLPERLYSIKSSAFSGCGNLAQLIIRSERLTEIGSAAFSGCYKLYEIYNLSDIVITLGADDNGGIGKYAKVVHTSLDEEALVNVDENGFISYTSDTENLLFGYVGSESKIVLPALIGGKEYLIVDSAFHNNNSITGVVIPDGVQTIGSNAFYYCTNLTSVVIGDGVQTIGDYAFYNCDYLTSVVIGDGVQTIGSNAFRDCDNLTSVVIGESVQNIGNQAFNYCYNLIEVINKSELNITVGSSSHGCVAYYAAKVHAGETAGEFVTVGDFVFYIHDGVNYLARYKGSEKNLTLPESYNGQGYVIRNWAFYDNNYITEVVIPVGVTSIGDYAFYDCDNLTSVVIGDGVQTIGSSAFYDCDSLTSIVIGDGVQNIGDQAFYYCYNLIEVINRSELDIVACSTSNGYVAYYAAKVHSGETAGEFVPVGDFVFYIHDGVNYLARYMGSEKNLTLPESYNGQGYVIRNWAFYNNNITEVVIPDGVTSIGNYAFYYCTNLTSVVIGDGVQTIGSSAFYYCTSLTSVVIGDGVQTIGSSAFHSCDNLTTVVIGDGVQTIGSFAFYNCDNLTSVVIGNGVQTIGNQAFYDCTSLASLVIGDGVQTIESYAFYNCGSLTDVYYVGSEEEWGDISISYGNDKLKNANIHYDYVAN